ncbi:MAG: inositol monophosphatase, partial [Alphaproteobacteria bacterium]|nr:inositol monophosphatase [Alphaproteobacteria bacterium]
ERTIRYELEKARPDFGFLMEESGETKGADTENRWIVDPLDGTTNFLHGVPHFSISIALENKGQIIAGVIHNPTNDETFCAEKGKGTFLISPHGDKRLRVSARHNLNESLIGTGMPFCGHGNPERYLKQLDAVIDKTAGVRRNGAASLDLAYVAAGRFDGFWEMDLKPWDIAAGIIIIREAGGFVCDIKGSEETSDILTSGNIVCANIKLLERLKKLIK